MSGKETIDESSNPFCDACKEKDCVVSFDGTCAYIRKHQKMFKLICDLERNLKTHSISERGSLLDRCYEVIND